MMKSLKWLALVALLPTSAFALITGSAHDLNNTKATGIRSGAGTNGTNEICVFCHTPHRQGSTFTVLWNRFDSSGYAAWTWGGTGKTTAGTTLPTSLPNTVSKRCLNCHDGSVAIGALANVGGTAATYQLQGGTVGTDYNANFQLLSGSGSLVGGGGNMQGHHPVSIPYGNNGVYNGLTPNPNVVTDGAAGNYRAVLTSGCTGSTTGFCPNAATIAGSVNINIYKGALTGETGYGIECTSCHDVHNEFVQSRFLRLANTGSNLCLSCHNK